MVALGTQIYEILPYDRNSFVDSRDLKAPYVLVKELSKESDFVVILAEFQ